MTDVPASIRIEVPEDRFGDAYTTNGKREWVEKRQRIGRGIRKQLEEIENIYEDEKAFKEACQAYAQIFTDWTLSADDGLLPKPWDNPDAFEALMNSDTRLFLWLIELSYAPMSEFLSPDPN